MMPPGMIMDRNTPAAAMLDMAAVDPRDVVATYGLDVHGDRELEPRIENSVKFCHGGRTARPSCSMPTILPN